MEKLITRRILSREEIQKFFPIEFIGNRYSWHFKTLNRAHKFKCSELKNGWNGGPATYDFYGTVQKGYIKDNNEVLIVSDGWRIPIDFCEDEFKIPEELWQIK